MIEMLGVLAIIGVLSAGGIMGYSAAMENHKINKTIDDIHTMTANMRTFLLGKTSAVRQNVLANQLLAIGVIPSSYKLMDSQPCTGILNCNVTSVFGTPFRIYFADRVGENVRMIFYFIYDIPLKPCVKFAMHDWKSVGVYRYVVELWKGEKKTALYAPVSASSAKTLCEGIDFMGVGFDLNKRVSVN